MTSVYRRKAFVDNVADLSDGALECHAFGHAWEGRVMRVGPVGTDAWTLKLRCVSCSKERTDLLEPGTYELLNRRYTAPDGFRVVEPASMTDYRQEVVRRGSMRRKGAPGRFGRVRSNGHVGNGEAAED